MKIDAGMLIGSVVAMVVTASTNDISSDHALRAWSITGALCGGAMSALIGDSDRMVKRLAKFFGSALAGFVFTPALVIWQGWPIQPDIVMAAAGALSVLSWGALQVASKMAPRFFKARADALLLKSKDDNDKNEEHA